MPFARALRCDDRVDDPILDAGSKVSIGSKTDWVLVDATTDKDIARVVADDPGARTKEAKAEEKRSHRRERGQRREKGLS